MNGLYPDPTATVDARRVADAMHDATCRTNHIDGCGYHYGQTGQYVRRATRALATTGLTADQLITAYGALK